MKDEKSVHSGHRSRMKARFMQGGLKQFQDHEVLELLLFYAIPQGNVNELAHRLLDSFGSLSGVLDATPEALRKMSGVGEHTISLIKLLPALFSRYQLSQQDSTAVLRDRLEARWLLAPYFFGVRDELLVVLCLDAKQKVLGIERLQSGIVNSVGISTRQVMETALAFKSAAVILSHNHPSGNALPSAEDIASTKHLSEVLAHVGVTLWDHLIFADGDMVSMRDSRYL